MTDDYDVLAAVLALTVTETRALTDEERVAIRWAKQLLAKEVGVPHAD